MKNLYFDALHVDKDYKKSMVLKTADVVGHFVENSTRLKVFILKGTHQGIITTDFYIEAGSFINYINNYIVPVKMRFSDVNKRLIYQMKLISKNRGALPNILKVSDANGNYSQTIHDLNDEFQLISGNKWLLNLDAIKDFIARSRFSKKHKYELNDRIKHLIPNIQMAVAAQINQIVVKEYFTQFNDTTKTKQQVTEDLRKRWNLLYSYYLAETGHNVFENIYTFDAKEIPVLNNKSAKINKLKTIVYNENHRLICALFYLAVNTFKDTDINSKYTKLKQTKIDII